MQSITRIGACALLAALVVLGTPLAARASHSFTIKNQGSHTIDHVYLSNVDQDTWGPDQLASDETIDPGEKRTWRIPNSECTQDIKVVYHDGHSHVEKSFDTCQYDLRMDY